MSGRSPSKSGDTGAGQATTELLVALPLIVLVALIAFQIALVGHAWWRVSEAARIGARAAAVGQGIGRGAAHGRAARAVDRALPRMLRGGRRLAVSSSGGVALSVRTPLVPPFNVMARSAPRIAARARFER